MTLFSVNGDSQSEHGMKERVLATCVPRVVFVDAKSV